MKMALGVVAAAAVMGTGLVPANVTPGELAPAAPGTSAAAIEKATEKAGDPNTALLERMSNTEQDLLNSWKAKSVLLDASTGEVLSVNDGDVAQVAELIARHRAIRGVPPLSGVGKDDGAPSGRIR